MIEKYCIIKINNNNEKYILQQMSYNIYVYRELHKHTEIFNDIFELHMYICTEWRRIKRVDQEWFAESGSFWKVSLITSNIFIW